MSDEKDPKELSEAAAKAVAKLEAVRAVKQLNNGDSPWTIPQEILQEIQAGHIVANPDKLPPVTQMVEELKSEIELRYEQDEDLKNLLLESIPEVRSVRVWLKKDGWDEAVWKRVRGDRLFSPEKRAQVIEALRERAVNGSDQAAKTWLTMSGDFSDKMEVNDKSLDAYREINNILHRKSRED